MRYIIRLRLANELGEGFTDIATDEVTAMALIDAGCDSWKTSGPYEREPSVTYIETYNLGYVQLLGSQRDAYRKEAEQAVKLAAALDKELESKKAVLAATRGDLAKAQRSTR